MVLDTKVLLGIHNTFFKYRNTYIDPSNCDNTDIEKTESKLR